MQQLKQAYVASLMSRNLTDAWVHANPSTYQDLVTQSLQYRRPVSVIAAQLAAVLAFDMSRQSSQLTQRALVVHGDADRVIPIDCGLRLAGALPNGYRTTATAHRC